MRRQGHFYDKVKSTDFELLRQIFERFELNCNFTTGQVARADPTSFHNYASTKRRLQRLCYFGYLEEHGGKYRLVWKPPPKNSNQLLYTYTTTVQAKRRIQSMVNALEHGSPSIKRFYVNNFVRFIESLCLLGGVIGKDVEIVVVPQKGLAKPLARLLNLLLKESVSSGLIAPA